MGRRKNSSDEEEIEISHDDLKIIFDGRLDVIDLYAGNVFCGRCIEHMTTIVDYKIFLNERCDTILKGQCKKCGGPVARYIETGDSYDPKTTEAAKHVWTVAKKFRVIKGGKK